MVLVRLHIGHYRLNSHMHSKLKLAPSPTCLCGQKDQTTRARSTKMPPSQSYKRRYVACQHFPDDQTLQLQAGAGEDDVIHLPSGLDRVVCERQGEEDADVAFLLLIRQASNISQRRSVWIKDTHSKICHLGFALYS